MCYIQGLQIIIMKNSYAIFNFGCVILGYQNLIHSL